MLKTKTKTKLKMIIKLKLKLKLINKSKLKNTALNPKYIRDRNKIAGANSNTTLYVDRCIFDLAVTNNGFNN